MGEDQISNSQFDPAGAVLQNRPAISDYPQELSQPVAAPLPAIDFTGGQPQPSQPVNLSELATAVKADILRDPYIRKGALATPYVDGKTLQKFDDQAFGYIPGIDNDDFYGSRQGAVSSFFEGAGKFVGRAAVGTVAKTFEGVGYLGSMLNPYNMFSKGSYIEKVADNGLSSAFKELDEYSKNEWMPTFQEAADRDKGFWMRFATDGDFWQNEVSDGLAFMVSAFVPGMALSKAGMGLKFATALGRMRGAGGLAVGASELEASIEGARAIGNYFPRAQRIATAFDNITTWATATASESMFEANEVKNNIKNHLKYDEYGRIRINPLTGQAYTNKEISEISASAAKDSFIMNSILLGATNYYQFKSILKALGKAEQSSLKGFINPGASLLDDATLNPFTNKWLIAGREAALGIGREGFIEENMQLAIQRINEQYGQQGKVSRYYDFLNKSSQVGSQYFKQTLDALAGDDTETATNIGLGAILGGPANVMGGIRQENSDRKAAENAVTAFNNAKHSWLKFGNIYKTELVGDQKDENGNLVQKEKFILDNNGNPIVDESKVFAVLTGLQLNSEMFEELDKSARSDSKYHYLYKRDFAFSDFVLAHINAGAEEALLQKLDKLEKGSPEDLIQFGLSKDENFNATVRYHKELANRIIQQNKLLNDGILFNNSKHDFARKAYLSQIAAQHAIYKNILGTISSDYNNAYNQLVNNDLDYSSTDSFVDQLNMLLVRIMRQEEVVKSLEESGKEKTKPIQGYKDLVKNLKQELEELKKNNPEQLKDLKLDEEGYYMYQKPSRNGAKFRNALLPLESKKAEFLNQIVNDATEWIYYADNAEGSKRYKEHWDNGEKLEKERVDKLNKAAEEAKKKAEEAAKPVDTNQKDDKKEDSGITVTEEDDTETVKVISDDDSKKTDNSNLEEGTLPHLEEYLKDTHRKVKAVVDSGGGNYMAYSLWRNSAAVDKSIQEYNRKYNTNFTRNSKPEESKPPVQEKPEIDQAKLKEEKSKITSAEAKELLRQVKFFLENPKEPTVVGSVVNKYPNLYRAVSELQYSINQLEKQLQSKIDDLVSKGAAKADAENITYKELSDKDRLAFEKLKADLNDLITVNKQQQEKEQKENSLIDKINKLVFNAKPSLQNTLYKITDILNDIKDSVRRFGLDNERLIDALKNKLKEIKDDSVRQAIEKLLIPGSESSESSGYKPYNIDNETSPKDPKGRVSISSDEAATGLIIQGAKDLSNALSTVVGPKNSAIIVFADRKYPNIKRKDLESFKLRNNVPNRNHATTESDPVVEQVRLGNPVITVMSRTDYFGTVINIKNANSRVRGTPYMTGIQSYAISYPDNRTEEVTFSDEQRDLVKSLMVIADGKGSFREMTDQEYNKFQKMHKHVMAYYAEVEAFLDSINAPADATNVDITDIFNKYFDITNATIFSQPVNLGESLSSVIKKTTSTSVNFKIRVAKEDGTIVEDTYPLIAQKVDEKWEYRFVLNPGENIVDENDEVVIDKDAHLKTIIQNTLGKNPEELLTSKFPGIYAWIALDGNQYKPYTLKRDRGTEAKYLLKLATALNELKKSILEGSKSNSYNYKGQTYPSLNELLKQFNINEYSFYKANTPSGSTWFVNLDWDKKDKKFALEIRPDDETQELVGPGKLKVVLNTDDLLSIDENTSEDKINQIYKNLVDSVKKTYAEEIDKLSKSQDEVDRRIASQIKPEFLYDYKDENGEKVFRLKLVDQSLSFDDLNLYKFDAYKSVANSESSLKSMRVVAKQQPFISSDAGADISVTSSTPAAPSQSAPDSGQPGVTRKKLINVTNKDDGFLLAENEDIESYTANSYNEEVLWLKEVLANSGIEIKDLGTILANLKTGKQVLGYYRDRAIYVSQSLSQKGTIYHEAFHGLFRDIMTAKQRAFYLMKARQKMGTPNKSEIDQFRADRNYTTKTDQEIINLMAEEVLAEGFRKYKLNKAEPAESWFKKFIKLLDRIINFFVSSNDAINDLYNSFDNGDFASLRSTEPSGINNEGVFALAYGRPRITAIGVDPETGEEGYEFTTNVPLKLNIQNELVNKLTRAVANQSSDFAFEDRFASAVNDLKAEYDIEKLIKSSDPSNESLIRTKFENDFNEAAFVLGKSVPYALSEALANDPDALSERVVAESNNPSLELIKELVKNKISDLGLSSGFLNDDLAFPEDEETKAEKTRGGEYDKVNINPLSGLSREFRSLFGLIEYTYEDPDTGLKFKKVADGNLLFNVMMKMSANKSVEQIFPTLASTVDMMKEDDSIYYPVLSAFADFIKQQFGIDDLSDSNAKPTKNFHLYSQFINTFFAADLHNYTIKTSTNLLGSSSDVYDGSVNLDAKEKVEAIKDHYNREYRKYNADQKKQFEEAFEELQKFIKGSLFTKDKELALGSKVNNRADLNKLVKLLKSKLDAVNIVLPAHVIRQSLIAIYVKEDGGTLRANTSALRDYNLDQVLMNKGAYLQKDFFQSLGFLPKKYLPTLFTDNREQGGAVDTDKKVRTIGAVLTKASEYIIKYDFKAISVYPNAAGDNIYRYTKHTPTSLISQIIKEKGIGALSEMYPVLKEFLDDNIYFQDTVKNDLFLKNFEFAVFGGVRQEIEQRGKSEVTFGDIDERALLHSGVVFFLNRQIINGTTKDNKGNTVSITTFKRSRTQEEATSTNFLVSALYNRFTKEGQVSDAFVDNMMAALKQEYNRIQRQWMLRQDPSVVRLDGYNNNVNPETKQPIEGDSYTVTDEDGNPKEIKLRAYRFLNLENFFDAFGQLDDIKKLRKALQDALIAGAKNELNFESVINSVTNDIKLEDLLRGQLKKYAGDTFLDLKEELVKTGLATKTLNEETGETEYSYSDLIPKQIKTITEKGPDKTSLSDVYSSTGEMLLDYHLNVFSNKIFVNQMFDGDIAMGIKSAIEYYKRNKAGVISGDNGKTGYHRTATIEDLVADVNMEDLTAPVQEVSDQTTSKNKIKIADGQSYHVLNHRMRLLDSYGRLDAEVRTILQAHKYRKLTKQENDKLNRKKVVLNPLKTATGGILEYYKLSEHLLSRVDVSHLQVPTYLQNDIKTNEDAYKYLDDLYSLIEQLEDIVRLDPTRSDLQDIEDRIRSQYEKIHDFWAPKRGREKLHYLLNSMELSGVDQVFDTNASKKSTLVPTKLNTDGTTDLRASSSWTNNQFKFMQVETSGVHSHIKLPTQARQLLTTYISMLDGVSTKSVSTENKLKKMTLTELANEYSKTLGEISKSSLAQLEKAILDEKGEVNIAQVFDAIYRGLKKQGADSNTLKYFEVRDGRPVYEGGVNIPFIKKQFTYYYFSLFNDAVFSQRVSGRSDILVSSWGYEVLYDTLDGSIITQEMQDQNPQAYQDADRFKTRALGVSVEEKNGVKVYTMEVIIPSIYAENEAEKQLYLTKLNKFFSTRIPTEDRRSMFVAKVVDYMDAAYVNSIVVPHAVHILSGSDLDIDKVYSHTFATYRDNSDRLHIYGDYSGYESDSDGRFVEYIYHMLDDPAYSDLVDKELELMTKKPVFSKDFRNLAEEFRITLQDETELKETLNELLSLNEALQTEKYNREIILNATWKAYREVERTEQTSRDFQDKKVAYYEARDAYNASVNTIDETAEQLSRINRTLRLAALINVLKNKNMPVTKKTFASFIKDNYNPVISLMQNISLQQKMDLLSNERVFIDYYITERSSVEEYEKLAEDIGVTPSSVIKRNSIHSVLGDVVANYLNNTNKDGIGITASFNKFMAFAVKNNLRLPEVLLRHISSSEDKVETTDFEIVGGISKIGKQLGMFADAAKAPYPALFNLNPDTTGISNVILGSTGNLQLALLINKIPFVDQIIRSYINDKSAIEESGKTTPKSLKTRFNNFKINALKQLLKENRIEQYYEIKKDKAGTIEKTVRKFYFKTTQPEDISNISPENISYQNLGLQLVYEDGTFVAPDVADIFVADTITDVIDLNTDILRLGKILNLIKNQNPDFSELDSVITNYRYFLKGNSSFGSSIAKILQGSTEYKPLVKAAETMSDFSRKVLIDRSQIFKGMNDILNMGMTNTFGNEKAKENISEQLIKLIIVQKTKNNLINEIEALTKSGERPNRKVMLEKALRYFTKDYWLGNNTFQEDLTYLYENHSGNPFVTYLKVNERQGLDFVEATSILKLDKDTTNDIINGYEALQKSKDERTKMLAHQLFYYLLAKDGMGYAKYTFLKYINPDIDAFERMTKDLQEFLPIARSTEFIDDQTPEEEVIEAYQKLNKKIDQFFFGQTSRAGKINDWVTAMIDKVFSYSGNLEYMFKRAERTTFLSDMRSLIKAGVFSNLTEENTKGSKLSISMFNDEKQFTVDFSKVGNDPKLIEAVTKMYKYNDVEISSDGIGSFRFDLLITDGKRLFKLLEVDGNNINEKLGLLAMGAGRDIVDPDTLLNGVKGAYIELDLQGTKDLLSFGFTREDGKALHDAAKAHDEKLKTRKSGDVVFTKGGVPVNPSAISDNKPSQEPLPPAKPEIKKSPSNPGKKAFSVSFSAERQAQIIKNYSKKHGLTEEEATAQIYDGIAKGGQKSVDKLDECY